MRAGRLPTRRKTEPGRPGSALILTVVLTSLLAIAGVLFVMAARIDRMATSAASENQELRFAVDTVVAQIREMLVLDVLEGDGQEYYDFPDANNPWLAELEPYESGGEYYWRQISSLTRALAGTAENVEVRVVGNHDPIDVDDTGANADADGDGIGDSRWYEVPGLTSSKGRPIYAAVRIVDNGGMLNVNTGWKFVPDHPDPNRVDGSTQLQINAAALGVAPADFWTTGEEDAARSLQLARTDNRDDGTMVGLNLYESDVVWRYDRVISNENDPNLTYTLFDLSDELELRYRYLLNHTDIDTRVEQWGSLRRDTISTPVDSAGQELDEWFLRATGLPLSGLDPNYAYRHATTTWSMDRIITPQALQTASGAQRRKMVNVNTADPDRIRAAIEAALREADPNRLDVAADAAQIAANLIDFIDDDSDITTFDAGSSRIYGFERPCVYISELAYHGVTDGGGTDHESFAIELYKPYFEDDDPDSGDWRLVIDNPLEDDVDGEPIEWSGIRRFHVLRIEDPLASLPVVFSDPCEPADTLGYGYDSSLYEQSVQELDDEARFSANATIELQRRMGSGGAWETVDRVRVPHAWMTKDGVARSVERDIAPHKCVRRMWDSVANESPTLGAANNFVDEDEGLVQAHPLDKTLTNIGELGMVFAKSAYDVPDRATAAGLLLDLRDPNYASLFRYLTVMDPTSHGKGPRETRVKGRVNVNTAPAFVLGQLPWMQYGDNAPFEKAQAIVDYRNANGPYESIAELMQVSALGMLAADGLDNQHNNTPRGPDFTFDTARDDFEERDLIFTRISNLVTVRSDVFTAYILVRLGTNGPQKRIVAIFDRSDVESLRDDARLMGWHQTPDPR